MIAADPIADSLAGPGWRAGASAGEAQRASRAWLWVALVALLVVAQSLLVVLTLRFEATRAQEAADEAAAAALGEIRRRTQLALQGLQGLQPRPVSRKSGPATLTRCCAACPSWAGSSGVAGPQRF